MLPAPTAVSAVTAWRVEPLAVVGLVAAALWYARGWRRARPQPFGWPTRRPIAFTAGLVLTAWALLGWPAVYAPVLMWAWTMQVLTLLLVCPVLLMAGQPIALSRVGGGPLSRFADSRAVRVLGSAFVSPLLVPVACGVLFFARIGDLAAIHATVSTAVGLAVLALGALVARPLTDSEDRRSSVAVGLGLAVGVFELLLDAVPGIVLRLSTHPVATWFVHGRPGWAGGWLADQELAGNLAWSVAELLDLPFLVIVFALWVRADRREAADLDAQHTAARALAGTDPDAADRPWFLDDPRLRDRFER